MVEPGPAFSVVDVHRGWRTAFEQAGHQVVNYNLADRLTFYSSVEMAVAGGYERAVDPETAKLMAVQGVWEAAMRWWPHVLFVTSGFFTPTGMLDVLRSRGIKVVILHTESPYEDDRQLQLAAHADVNIVNDPTNLDTFQMVAPASIYLPHSYDPQMHHPAEPDADDVRSDVCFVGTGYPSRIEFLEQVDWSGLDVVFAGNWQALDEWSPLRKFVIHDLEECWPNEQTVGLYRGAKCSFNLYRREANMPSLSEGYSMGPREVELSAVGCFWLRDPRPESDDVFPMLPSFTTPGELGDQLRWWCAHDAERVEAAAQAREAVAGWTFQRRAEQLMSLI